MAGGNILLVWRDEFDVGIDGVDEQHRKLVSLINDLWDATVRGLPVALLMTHLDELERYTGYHFADEEEAMGAAGYPQLAEHRLAHQGFIKRVAAERQKALREGYVTLNLVHFLRDWLLQHIAVQDKHYAAFVRESGQRGSFFSRLLRRFA